MQTQTLFDLFPAMREVRRLAAELKGTQAPSPSLDAAFQEKAEFVSATLADMGVSDSRAWAIFEAQEAPRILARLSTLESNLGSTLQFVEWKDDALIAMESERANLRLQIGLN